MQEKIIITNNPLLKEKFKDIEKIFVDSTAEVYQRSRDLIHHNWRLVSHPLAGSVKPAQNPYRSLILTSAAELDFYSLKTIENAVSKLKQFQKHHQKREYPPKIIKDYQLIDLTLINSALKN